VTQELCIDQPFQDDIVEVNFCIPLSQRVERDFLLYINSLQSKIYELTRAYDVTFESMVGSKTLFRVIFCREKKSIDVVI
jgi:hypothetical protein